MDKTTEIILEIENAERISFEQSFKIVSYCTQLLSQHSAEAELSARKIVIHVLNNWGKIDKNLYVWVTDGGADKVQMKITLTMPKVQVAADAAQSVPEPEMSGGAWETATSKQEKCPHAPTTEDQNKIDELMNKLDLSDK